MKVVRLNTHEFRQWRANQAFLVNAQGEPQRQLSPQEERVASELADQAKRSRTTIVKEFEAPNEEGKTLEVKCVAESFGQSGETVLVKTYVDGMLEVPSRQLIKARLLKEHGECQVRGPNNVVIATVRDPHLERPTPRDAMRTAPRPANCQCKDWGEPHPGMHHPICQYNKIAPKEEQALSTRVTEEQLIEVPKGQSSVVAPPATSATPPNPDVALIPSEPEPLGDSDVHEPGKCPNACLNWAWPPGQVKPSDDSQHHPICQYQPAWESHTSVAKYVCDLDTGKAIRLATKDEIAEADISERRSAAPTITIGEGAGKEVYVVLSEEADLSELKRETVSSEPTTANEPSATT